MCHSALPSAAGVVTRCLPQDAEGCTALHVAADGGNAAAVALLLQHGAGADTQSYHGDTPLILAAANGHADVVLALVDAGVLGVGRWGGGGAASSR